MEPLSHGNSQQKTVTARKSSKTGYCHYGTKGPQEWYSTIEIYVKHFMSQLKYQ
jgi:hypothetical protein